MHIGDIAMRLGMVRPLSSIGVNIDYVANDSFGRAGYVIDPRGYFLEETVLEPEDAMLLAVLQRTLGVVDDPLGRNLKSALAKASSAF